jgi:hypothetical protein
MISELDRLKATLSSLPLSSHKAVTLMVYIRVLLEQSKAGSKYPMLHLYCNWVAHPALDKVAACICIEQVNAVFQAAVDRAIQSSGRQTVVEYNQVFHDISRIMVKEFRNELGSFLFDHLLETVITRDERNWRPFIHTLLHELIGRPLSFPSKIRPKSKEAKIWKRMGSKTNVTNFLVKRFAYVRCREADKLCWELGLYRAQAGSTVFMAGELVF